MSLPTTPARRAAAEPVDSPAVAGALPEHLAQIKAARITLVPIRRAANWATMNGWIVLSFGVLSILFSFGINLGLALGIVMTILGWRDITTAKSLRRLDTNAIPQLIKGQIALGVSLAIYFGWYLYDSITGPGPLAAESQMIGDTTGMLKGYDNLARSLTSAGYGLLLAFAFIEPACTAWYFRSRQQKLQSCLAKLPSWLVELQRNGVNV